MTPQSLIQTALNEGVRIRINGTNLRLRGSDDAIRKVAPILKPHKAEIIAFLRDGAISAQVREFMEVDGMTLEEAQAWEAQSVTPRSTHEWLDLIQRLDELIERWCTTRNVSATVKACILEARYRQSLASIPETLDWFERELALNSNERK